MRPDLRDLQLPAAAGRYLLRRQQPVHRGRPLRRRHLRVHHPGQLSPAPACHGDVACDPLTGTCPDPPPSADGAACDDASACTESDLCVAGTCRGTALADGTSCGDGTCSKGQRSTGAPGTPDNPMGHYSCTRGGSGPSARVALVLALTFRRRPRAALLALLSACWHLPGAADAQNAAAGRPAKTAGAAAAKKGPAREAIS